MSDEISVSQTPHWIKLTTPKELDLRHWSKLNDICGQYANNRRYRWMLDLRHTTKIRDTGVAALIRLKQSVCGRAKPLPVTNAAPHIRDRLVAVGLL